MPASFPLLSLTLTQCQGEGAPEVGRRGSTDPRWLDDRGGSDQRDVMVDLTSHTKSPTAALTCEDTFEIFSKPHSDLCVPLANRATRDSRLHLLCFAVPLLCHRLLSLAASSGRALSAAWSGLRNLGLNPWLTDRKECCASGLCFPRTSEV